MQLSIIGIAAPSEESNRYADLKALVDDAEE